MAPLFFPYNRNSSARYYIYLMHQPCDRYFESLWVAPWAITVNFALSSARPASLTKGLQFSVQPVKIMDSESFLIAGPISRRAVRCKGLG
jgi:hypothetical protein